MRILLVEDDDYKARTVMNELTGHEVVHEKAINPGLRQLLKGERFDGVILDMGLPRWADGQGLQADMGLQFLSEMDRKGNETPVLVCSGSLYDVSEHEQVLGYIHFNSSVSIHKPVKEFLDKLMS
jgi:DNA-binding response OmpR family regulator